VIDFGGIHVVNEMGIEEAMCFNALRKTCSEKIDSSIRTKVMFEEQISNRAF